MSGSISFKIEFVLFGKKTNVTEFKLFIFGCVELFYTDSIGFFSSFIDTLSQNVSNLV